MSQCKQFEPGFTLGERADKLEKLDDGSFIVTTNKLQNIIKLCNSRRSWKFEPRKPVLENLQKHELMELITD